MADLTPWTFSVDKGPARRQHCVLIDALYIDWLKQLIYSFSCSMLGGELGC
jgi:hypothetical protein